MEQQPHIVQPDYQGGSIVNLMSSILQAFGNNTNSHVALNHLEIELLTRATNIVLLVLDGLGYHYLCEQGRRSSLHQHLQAKMTTVFPSTTATAITTFMTGLAPQQHGLTGWFTYFEELESVVTVLPCRTRYSKHNGNITIDARALYGHTPVFDLLNVESYIVTPKNIAYSEYSLSHRGKGTIKPYETLAECFDFTTDIIMSSPQRKYLYTYWPEFDGMAHQKGVESQDVANHFADIDKAFAKFIGDIRGSNTLVIATADHGIIDSGPELCVEIEEYPELQEMLLMPLSGERRIPYCYVKPDRQQEFKKYINDNFSDQIELYESSELLNNNFYGLGEPNPRIHKRIGDYMLSMKGNMTIMDTLPHEKRFFHIGTHGGLSEREMTVPLIIVQP